MRRSQRKRNSNVAEEEEEEEMEQATPPQRSSRSTRNQAPAPEEIQPYPEQLMMSEGVVLRSAEPTKKEKIAAARRRYSKLTEQEPEHPAQLDPEPEEPKPKNRRLEIQRNKYHAMTPEQKKEYNAKRTELGRKRRREEDEILQLVKRGGNVSAELMAKAEIIKEKRRRNAERAKLRYDSMSNSEKKKHNKGRTAARRTRTTGSQDSFGMEPYDESSNDYSMPGPSDAHTTSFFDDDDEDLSDDE
ncbi:hypothetical protein CAEBREN_20567 [Caenorhabditis brenneri]|uniref:Uncharacterized protein n=1 Tax=Caenorhabditis brenneri TaxID=135651 RepID=G0MMD5_CAEBE|nr:hypothetical protein CAEBREN_20567 [Caenorhabditis brenneri]